MSAKQSGGLKGRSRSQLRQRSLSRTAPTLRGQGPLLRGALLHVAARGRSYDRGYKTAATRRASPANTLNVLAAAALSITSRPTPRRANANVSSRGGNSFFAPLPTITSSGDCSSNAEKWSSVNSARGTGFHESIISSGVRATASVHNWSLIQMLVCHSESIARRSRSSERSSRDLQKTGRSSSETG